MKDILKIVIPIIIVAVITFILCIIFIKPKVLSIKSTKEYEYIQNNKKNMQKTMPNIQKKLYIRQCENFSVNSDLL